jgi:hypothetical protein
MAQRLEWRYSDGDVAGVAIVDDISDKERRRYELTNQNLAPRPRRAGD